MNKVIKLGSILLFVLILISFVYSTPGATCIKSGYVGPPGGCEIKEYCNNEKKCVSVPEIQINSCPNGFVKVAYEYCIQSYCNKSSSFQSTYYQYSAAGKCAWNDGPIFNEYHITCEPTSEDPASLVLYFYQLNKNRSGARGNSYFAQVPNSKKYCNQNLKVNIVGSGSVSFSETTTPCTSTCTKSFLGSKTITLTPTPLNGFDFNGWSGDCSGTTTCTIQMSDVPNVTATFIKEICDGIDNTGNGLVDVNLNPVTNLVESVCDCFNNESNVFSLSNTLGTNHPNLVGYWPMDNLTSNITQDINGRIRAVYDSQTINVTKTLGLFESALSFNGKTSTAHIKSNDMLKNVSGATLSAWIKPTSTTLTGLRGIISISVGETDYRDSWSRASIALNGGKIRIVAREVDGTSAAATFETTNNVITANGWNHVIGLINYSNNTAKVYVNGVQKPLTPLPNNYWTSKSTTPDTNSFESSIGSEDWGSDILPPNRENAFSGLIDDVAIFNTTISECEIKKLALGPSACLDPCYFCTGPDSSIIGQGEQRIYYKFEKVPFGEECIFEYRECLESNLSGSFEFPTCTINEPILYECDGKIDSNAAIIEGDDFWVLEPTINTLVDSNTSAKCEWICSNTTIFDGEKCVCPIETMWLNNKCTPINELEKPIDAINSIINLNYTIDQNLNIISQCLYNDFDSNIEIRKNGEIIYSKTKITCGINSTTHVFDSSILEENDLLEVTTTINTPCDVCLKTIYLNYKKNQIQKNNIIPDNNLVLVIVLLLSIIILIKVKK